ncbi:MAG: PEP-utilizing enzyme, partial [Chlorobi bacterium]|nr:PEP-utilizing enzyme [Chlorobiota bacterium]
MNGNDPGGSGSGSTPIRYQLQGTAASRGIAIGNARKILPNLVQLIQWTPLAPAERHYHIERYEHARRELVESFRVGLGNAAYVPDTRAIVETYEMIVSDPDVDAAIRHHILTSGMPAEVAVTTAYNAHIRALSLAGTPEFRERRFELDIIRQKLLQFLSGSQTRSSDISGAIIVASSLLASDVVYYHSCGIAGIVTEIGGISSHACIVARSLGIPAVIGVRKALSVIPDDAVVIVDGSQGEVIVSPDATTLEQY